MGGVQHLPPPLSPRQDAVRIGLSVTAIYALCEAGQLAHRRVGVSGGRIKIDEADLQAYLDRTRVEAPATLSLRPAGASTTPQRSARRRGRGEAHVEGV